MPVDESIEGEDSTSDDGLIDDDSPSDEEAESYIAVFVPVSVLILISIVLFVICYKKYRAKKQSNDIK